VYREPHLQKKSDECAAIWYEWQHFWCEVKDKEKAKKIRKKWCKCCDEFDKILSHEVKTNARYKDLQM